MAARSRDRLIQQLQAQDALQIIQLTRQASGSALPMHTHLMTDVVSMYTEMGGLTMLSMHWHNTRVRTVI